MANVIPAVFTVDALRYIPLMLGGLKPFTTILSFKVGEGGWVTENGAAVPRTPSPSLRRLDTGLFQDIDAVVDDTRPSGEQRYVANRRGRYEQPFGSGDILEVTPSGIRLLCKIEAGDFNTNGSSLIPELYEIGIFADHPDYPGVQKLMIAYGTFPKETKNGNMLENIVVLTASGT